jgi:sucrose phosphorylase
MSDPFYFHLQPLYGAATAAALAPQVASLLDQWRPRLPRPLPYRNALDLSQRDVLLITYANQLSQPGALPLKTLAEFAVQNLADTVTGIHLLPFYPSSSDDGFSVKDFFAVDLSCGTWNEIALLRSHFDLMFDAVFNHVSAQGEWFEHFLADDPRYRDFFITISGNPDLSRVVRPRALPLLTEFSTPSGPKKVWTTFSADQVDLNFRQPAVLFAVLEVLLFYISQGARFIRLDAIAFLWKEVGTDCLHRPQTHLIIQFLRAVLDAVAPQVMLITETNVPHQDNLSYFGNGTNEAQLVYNFALPPLVLHSLQTGSAVALTRWAQSLALPSERAAFFNFLASHDGIGLNPVRGILADAEIDAMAQRTLANGGYLSYKSMPDGSRLPYEMNINYLDALSNPTENEPLELAARKFLTAHAILLSLQGVPGIYFHSLFGSRGDRAGAEASGIPRRINRQKLDAVRLQSELGIVGTLRSQVLAGQRFLLRLRRQHPAFAPAEPQRVLALDNRVFALVRQSCDGGDTVLCLHNVSPTPVTVSLKGVLPGSQWQPLWTSGSVLSTDSLLVLAPYHSSWLVAEPASAKKSPAR